MGAIKDLSVGGWSSHSLLQTGLGRPGQRHAVSLHALSCCRIRFRYRTKEAGRIRILLQGFLATFINSLRVLRPLRFSHRSQEHWRNSFSGLKRKKKKKNPIQKNTARHIHMTNTSWGLQHSASPRNQSSNKLFVIAKAFMEKPFSDSMGVPYREND